MEPGLTAVVQQLPTVFFQWYYSDGFPKVFKCENELVKATLMYLDDPDAPEGVAFIRWITSAKK